MFTTASGGGATAVTFVGTGLECLRIQIFDLYPIQRQQQVPRLNLVPELRKTDSEHSQGTLKLIVAGCFSTFGDAAWLQNCPRIPSPPLLKTRLTPSHPESIREPTCTEVVCPAESCCKHATMTGSGGSPAKPQPERQAVTTSTRMRLAFQPAAKIGLGICQCDFEPLQHQINSRGQQGRLPRSSKLLAPEWLPTMPCPLQTHNREGTEERKLGKRAAILMVAKSLCTSRSRVLLRLCSTLFQK